MEQYFRYGEQEIAYLKGKDKQLADVIDKVGMVKRRVIPDLFAALVHSIVGQQISTKAHETIWRKMVDALGEVTPEKILSLSPKELQAFGITFKKVDYIQAAARKIASGEFDIQALSAMDDNEVCAKLSELDGIGVWTAEMLMLHSLQRPDILSFGDLAVQRGLRMVYHHRKITRALFEKYRRRYSPYGSVACIYLWAVSAGAVEGLKDYALKQINDGRKQVMEKKNIIKIKRYESPCGVLMLGSIDDKLCLCDWQVEKHRDHVDRRPKRILNAGFEEGSSEVIEKAEQQLNEFFARKRRMFDVPLLFVGTEFQKTVWNFLLTIPFGKTISYGEMARQIGLPKAVRAVANANGANSISIFAPCHRVIGSDRSLTGYGGGLEAKRFMLELEGVL